MAHIIKNRYGTYKKTIGSLLEREQIFHRRFMPKSKLHELWRCAVFVNGRMVSNVCVYSSELDELVVESFSKDLFPQETARVLQVMHFKYNECIYCIIFDSGTFYGINLSTEEKLEPYSL